MEEKDSKGSKVEPCPASLFEYLESLGAL